MKTKKLFAVLLVFMFVSNILSASLGESNKNLKIAQFVQKQMSFPKIEKTIGQKVSVWVSFNLDETGKVVIGVINTSNKVFRKHVIQSLSEMDFSSKPELWGETFNLHIKFKVI